jgi:hypothetical protein
MREIYRDAVGETVELGIDNATSATVEFYRDEILKGSEPSSPATVPYSLTHMDGKFTAKWSYVVDGEAYSRSQVYNVVTPLFTQQELVGFNNQFVELDDSQVVNLERMCRQIIESTTGQSFGYREGTLKVSASRGGPVLMTGERVISVSGVGLYGLALAYPYAYRPIKTGFGIEAVGGGWDGDTYTTNGPITDPYAVQRIGFTAGTEYTINGAFGWEAIPTDIKDAALLLAELFSCNEATWRDRYLKAVTAADWRFDFDGRAFSGTGSVTVDNLLKKYVVGTMAII